MSLADNDTQQTTSTTDQVQVETVKIKSRYQKGNFDK